MKYRADLHNHSCLSPCGSLEMSPRRIVEGARAAGIDLLALTDHNSAKNLRPFSSLSKKAGIEPVYGIEATTREEIHVICLFPDLETCEALEAILGDLPSPIPNNPDHLGDQVYVDEDDFILGEVDYYLLQASELSFEALHQRVLSMGGLFIPAHVDRPSFSVFSQLGFLPDLPYSALEVSHTPDWRLEETLEGMGTLITGSDAHYQDGIGKKVFTFEAESRDFEGLVQALELGRVTLPEHF